MARTVRQPRVLGLWPGAAPDPDRLQAAGTAGMNAGECAQARNELGVYLLGAIEPGERAQAEDHLASCLACREELAALAGLPALLRKVPADEAMRTWTDDGAGQLPGPPLAALLSRVASTRRRRRHLTAVAAAALVAGVAAATAVQVFHAGAASPPAAAAARWAATATGANPATGVWAAIRYAAQPWGSELEVRVTGIPTGTRCQLWVTGARGQDIAAGGWTIASASQQGWYPASVPFPAGSLRGFEVTAGGKAQITVPAR
jgi:anti-sigma factor RsiW